MGDVYMASIDGDIDKLRQYVEYEGQSLTTRGACGAYPLHWASWHNHAHLIPYIVHQGGDVSAVDKDGRTALHWAASKGATAAADLLLQNGASVEAADNWGLRAVHVAANYGQTTFLNHITVNYQAKFATPDNNGKTPLHWAASCGCTDTIRQLLFWDRYQGRLDNEDNTPLHWASFSGKLEACIVLANVATKQQLSIRNKLGYTPAQLASKRGYLGVANFLINEEKRIEDHLTSFSRLGEDEFLRENVRRPSTSTKLFSPSYATNYATDSLSHAITLGQGRYDSYERIDMHPLYIKVVPANILDAYKQENHNEYFLELTSIAITRHPIKLVGAGNGSSVPDQLVPGRTEEDSLKNIQRQMLTRVIYGIFSALNGMFTEKPTPSVTGDVKPDNFHPLANNYFGDKLTELGLGCILPKPNPVRTTNNNDPSHSLGVKILRALTGKALGAIKNLILARSRKWLILKLVIGAVMWLRKGV